MECHQPILDVGPGHLGGAAHQHPHLAGPYFGKQFFFLPYLGIGFMDERDLLRGTPLGDELLPDVLVDGKGRFRLRQG